MKHQVRFQPPWKKVPPGDQVDICFPYSLVDMKFIGTPEERARTSQNEIDVVVTGTLLHLWKNQNPQADLVKIMFEYGKRHIIEKLRDHTLLKDEALVLSSHNVEHPCPYDSDRIDNPANAVVEIEVPEEGSLQMESDNTLAAAIIDARDNINAIFHEMHQGKLLIVNEERDLLQLFRDAKTQEEFSYRICALANAATGMNVPLLTKELGSKGNNEKSISLLSRYAETKGLDLSNSIAFLRAINALRNAYPVHTDVANDVLLAYRTLGISYPPRDYSKAWAQLLAKYLAVLQAILVALQQSSLPNKSEDNDCS